MARFEVGGGDLRISVEADVDEAALWPVASAAFEAAHNYFLDRFAKEKKKSKGRGNAERLREVAREVLADGKPHRRTEIRRVCRERGADPQNIAKALAGHFEESKDEDGSVLYRIPGWSGEPIEVLGTLGSNGSS